MKKSGKSKGERWVEVAGWKNAVRSEGLLKSDTIDGHDDAGEPAEVPIPHDARTEEQKTNDDIAAVKRRAIEKARDQARRNNPGATLK